MRFLGLGLDDRVPDANTIWPFREALTRAGAIKELFASFDAHSGGRLSGDGRADRRRLDRCRAQQRNTEAEKAAIKEGRIPEDWAAQPTKLAQKDRDARWTLKRSKARPRARTARRQVEIAIPVFGYKNHVGIDRPHGLIRRFTATDAAAHDGGQLTTCSTKTTPRAPCGPTPLTARKNERCWPGAASSRASAARTGAGRCRSSRQANARSRRCAPPSRLSLPARRTASALRQDHWPGPGEGEDRPRQPHLQHASPGLAQRPDRTSVDPGRRVRRHPRARGPVAQGPLTP